MIVFDIIKNSYRSVIENPSITLFLVLFLIVSNLVASYVLSAPNIMLGQIMIVCLFAFVCIFISGWFKVIQESIDREKIKDKKFYPIFLEGIGENILSVVLGSIIYCLVLFLGIFLSQKIAMTTFGNIDFFLNDLNSITQNNISLVEYFQGLTDEQKNVVYGWNFCILCGITLFNFLFLFYYPALISEKNASFLKKPFIAVWKNLKFLFKNFFGVLFVSILVHIIHMILAYLNAKFATNLILSIVFLMIYIYFLAIVVMILFNYYDKKTDSNNRADSVGENVSNNSIGEEN